jgi:hypothetical protein
VSFQNKSPQMRGNMASASWVAGGGGDQPHAASDATRLNASQNKPHYDEGGRFIHYCEHPGCDLWGTVGFDVSLRAGRLGRWFCAAHAEEFKQLLKAEKPKPAAKRPSEPLRRTDAGGQGRLL